MEFRRLIPSVPRAGQLWAQGQPYLAAILFLGCVVAMITLTIFQDREAARTALVNDVLWLEQNLQTQVRNARSQLEQIARDLHAPGAQPLAQQERLRQLLAGENGLTRVVLMDPRGLILSAYPPVTDGTAIPQLGDSTLAMAQNIGYPIHAAPLRLPQNEQGFAVVLPQYQGQQTMQSLLVGIFSFERLLQQQTPWWFAERYRLRILDDHGQVLAARSKQLPLYDDIQYQIPFDPPGQGITMQVETYRGETHWMQWLVITAITVLSCAIVWSLWRQRRHQQQRQAAEKALREEHAFRKAMEDSMLVGLLAQDLTGRITHVNRAFCKILGYEADTLVGLLPPFPYWPEETRQAIQHISDQILQGTPPLEGFELRLRHQDGHPIDCMLYVAPLIDADDVHTGWMSSLLDITERRQAEEAFRQQEARLQDTSRLVSLVEMATTLAHELNQPLAAIASYVTGCRNRLNVGDMSHSELTTIFERIHRQSERAANIVRRVRSLVRRNETRREPVHLNDLVRDAITLLEPDARQRDMRILSRLTEPLPDIEADKVMLEQVLVNLVRNAMDAMRDAPAPLREVRIETLLEEKEVILRVIDRGHGISPEVADKLFAPFFTTKAEGMGIGLNICRSIAELHGGRLWFIPNPEGGTIFCFALKSGWEVR